MNKIILASKSPRRIELLKLIVSNFEICPSHFDESQIIKLKPQAFVRKLAFEKANTIHADTNDIVIGCDTAVVLNDYILGKPKDKTDEICMLKALSGKTHSVITGVCILHENKKLSFESTTEVTFYPLSEIEINHYANSSEPYDKAGGYAIQGKGALFVKSIYGDYNNVVGMPIAELNRFLQPILHDNETLC